MAGPGKAERKEVEKEEEEEEKSEAQKQSLVDKAQRTICELLCAGKERRRCERKKAERRNKSPRAKQFL